MDEDIETQREDHAAAQSREPDVEEMAQAETAPPGEPNTEEAITEQAEAAQARAEAASQGREGRTEDVPEAAEEPRGERERTADASREASAASAEVWQTADEMARTTREHFVAAEERSMAPEYRGISFGDGFRFGCGFTIASCLFWLILSIVLAIIPVALSALNVIRLPGR